MEVKGAFIFLAPQSNGESAWVITPEVHLISVAVNNYEEAAQVAKKLVYEGIKAIELCGGFGHKGVAQVVEAVDGNAVVGVVRFDTHPALNRQSGDQLFE